MRKLKKRVRKPGVKVGPYKKRNKPSKITLDSPHYADMFKDAENVKIGDTLRIRLPNDFVVKDTNLIPLTLCEQLEEIIQRLENRINASITRIDNLM